MKLYLVRFIFIFLISKDIHVDGLFSGTSFQEYVDSFIDAGKFKLEGMLSLNDSAISQIWSYFKSNYGRVYSSFEEERQRLRIFRDHLRYIIESNLENFRTYELALNEFADWTIEEFDNWKKGLILPNSIRRRRHFHDESDQKSVDRSLRKLYQEHYYLRRIRKLLKRRRTNDKRFLLDWFLSLFHRDRKSQHPTDVFDWRTKNAVSSIKNQLKCGCCYAFSTSSIFETLYTLKNNLSNAIDFSVQQITDCSSNGNNGCKGGHFQPSIRYLQERGNKIAKESSYPYVGKKQSCQTNNLEEIHLGPIEYESIPEGDEKRMAEALVNYGPLFIGLDAESRRFIFYTSGILKIDRCPSRRQDMDHAMVIVGYGHDPALKMSYWIIKNSWGTKWGESGYLRLAKDEGNMCGVASMASYAKLV